MSAHVREVCPSGRDSSYQQHTCMLSCSTVSDFLWPRGLQRPQASLSTGLSRQEHWIIQTISSSRGSSWPRDGTCIYCRWILYHLRHQGSPATSRVGSFPLLVLWLSPRLTFSNCKFSIHIPYLCSIVTWRSFICARSWHKLAPSSTF